ncbi:MAG: VCBS repeat-containing protein, partial [Verrucomicrobium sp.]|nr:VCBS repeat-containing protein [Verrucomicrobium sp.]
MSRNSPKPEDPEEWVASDDSAIRAGLRWSLVILGALAVAGLGAFFALRKTEGPAKIQVTPLAAPQTVQTAQKLTLPKAPFSEVGEAAGVRFRHFTGAAGEKLLPETMGAGAAFFDADGDGDADLLLVNGNRWPWDTQGPASPGSALYRNDTAPGGAIRFTDISAGSGLETPFHGMGAAVGDYDNDGRPDVFITAVGGARLFHNEGGPFQGCHHHGRCRWQAGRLEHRGHLVRPRQRRRPRPLRGALREMVPRHRRRGGLQDRRLHP